MTKTIGILLFDGVEELDAVGPWEVLAAWTQTWPDDGWRAVTLSSDGATIRAAKGMVITPDHSFADAPNLDIVLHPGGMGADLLLGREDHLDWVRAQAASADIMTSVCTGSLVYAKVGLLRDLPATT